MKDVHRDTCCHAASHMPEYILDGLDVSRFPYGTTFRGDDRVSSHMSGTCHVTKQVRAIVEAQRLSLGCIDQTNGIKLDRDDLLVLRASVMR